MVMKLDELGIAKLQRSSNLLIIVILKKHTKANFKLKPLTFHKITNVSYTSVRVIKASVRNAFNMIKLHVATPLNRQIVPRGHTILDNF